MKRISANARYNELLKSSRSSYREGDVTAALNLLKQATLMLPLRFEAFRDRGLIYLTKLQPLKALNDFECVLRLSDEYVGINLFIGKAYLQLERWNLALSHLQKIPEHNSKYKQAQILIDKNDLQNKVHKRYSRDNAYEAESYLEKGVYEKVFYYAEKSQLEYPLRPQSYFIIGKAFLETAEYDKAVENFYQAKRLDITHEINELDFFFGLVFTKIHENQVVIEDGKLISKAIESFSTYLRHNSQDAKAYHRRALAYILSSKHHSDPKERFLKALSDLKLAVKYDPTNKMFIDLLDHLQKKLARDKKDAKSTNPDMQVKYVNIDNLPLSYFWNSTLNGDFRNVVVANTDFVYKDIRSYLNSSIHLNDETEKKGNMIFVSKQRRDRTQKSIFKFKLSMRTWYKKIRNSKANWILPDRYSSKYVIWDNIYTTVWLKQKDSNELQSKLNKIRDELNIDFGKYSRFEQWFPFANLEIIQFFKKRTAIVADVKFTLAMLQKDLLERQPDMSDFLQSEQLWNNLSEFIYSPFPISVLYQFESNAKFSKLLDSLVTKRITNIGHLQIFDDEFQNAVKDISINDWFRIRTILWEGLD